MKYSLSFSVGYSMGYAISVMEIIPELVLVLLNAAICDGDTVHISSSVLALIFALPLWAVQLTALPSPNTIQP
jgi:hypothetical protein